MKRPSNKLPLLAAVLLAALLSTPLAARERSAFVNLDEWPDDNGVHINAHGGGLLFHGGSYYWVGEHRGERRRDTIRRPGVRLYSSTDLYNWKDEGLILKVSEDPDSPITAGCIIERPKVVYNENTEQFVMWFHLELRGQGYNAALTGVATADDIRGPFEFVRALRPNPGIRPQNLSDAEAQALDAYLAGGLSLDERPGGIGRREWNGTQFFLRDFEGGQMARDMTVFKDEDGTVYHVFSSEENYTLHIAKLSDDYLSHTGEYIRFFPGGHNEAPAVFRDGDDYYLIASGCTGWDPNAARSYRAKSMFGPWEYLGNPAEGTNEELGMGPDRTFGGQSTFAFEVPGKPGNYVAMFDVWRPRDLNDSRYLWLPVELGERGITIPWKKRWSLDELE